ncbi:BppU family phage baseplate upper protein (plasmid) [Clostridium perfringens]
MATYFIQNTNSVEDIEQMNNVIEKVNKVNTTATSNIGQLTDLNNKAQELSNNIQEALPINTELKENIKIGQPLVQEAVSKNTELQASLEKTKEFINGLDGSQNIPQIRMDVTELQNGLKSNQSLEYSGSSITANDTLEGRTEGMKIKGRTLNNLYKANNIREDAGGKYILVDTLVKDEPKDRVVYIVNNTNRILLLNVYKINGGWDSNPIIRENSISKLDLTGKKLTGFLGMYDRGWTNSEADKELLRNTCIVLDREETYIPQKYFEGLKSFGDAEQEVDKYKISILSENKNLFKDKFLVKIEPLNEYGIDINSFLESGKVYTISTKNNNWFKISDFSSGTGINQELDVNKMTFTFNTETMRNNYLLINNNDFSLITNKEEILNKNIQIEEGEQATPYKPYQQDKKDILIKEPLRGFDENTCDIMYEDNGQVKVDRKLSEYTFTGDENWQPSSELQDELICFYISFPLTTATTPILCNNFIQKPTMEKGIECITNNGGGNSTVRIKINKSKLTTPDINGFKAWLKANPTTIVYQLAEPTVEIVENYVDIDLDTFGEKTYFNILNSLPGNLDFKVPSNLGSSLQNLAKEVNNIWDVINNLLVPSLIDINKNVAMSTIKNNLK